MRRPVVKPEGRVHIHRTVRDMKRSIDFYVTILGFYYDHGAPEMAWLTSEHLLLTLSPGEPQLDLGSYIGWAVSSLEELEQLYSRLSKRRVRISAPPDAAEQRYYFVTYDPDDYPIAFSLQTLEQS